MDEENKDIFDSVEGIKEEEVIEKPTKPVEDSEVDEPEDMGFEIEDFAPKLGTKSIKQKREEFGVKKNMDGKILTVKSWTITPPKVWKDKDKKEKIPPVQSKNINPNTGKYTFWYPTKLKIEFEEGDKIVEYVPGINIFLKEDGTLNDDVKLGILPNKKGVLSVTQTAQLGRLLLQKMSGDKFKLTEALVNEKTVMIVPEDDINNLIKAYEQFSETEILNFMVGKKFLIKTSTGNYQGNDWFRNNLVKIVD